MALKRPSTTSRALVAAVGAISLVASSSTVAHAASSSPRLSWFHDPISVTARAGEVPVPVSPASSVGRLRHTTATSRTHAGAIAVPLSWVTGHALLSAQAVDLPLSGLFGADTAVLTPAGRAAIASLGLSLAQVTGLTCEGYGDYAGTASHVLSLSNSRAAAACAAIQEAHPAVVTAHVGYGAGRPVAVGGFAADRRDNTRIVFVIKKSSVAAPALNAPKLVSVTPGDQSLAIVFNAATGGTGVYQYQVSLDGGLHWVALDAIGDSPYTAVLTGLINGQSYDVMVRAVTADGVTPASGGVVASPTPPPPGVPHGVTQGIPTAGNASATLTWSAPNTGGSPITGYEVQVNGGAWTALVPAGSATDPFSSTVTGLTNGTSYTFVIRATNSTGPGALSNPQTSTPYTLADPPNLTAAARGNSSATITFSAPAFDGGRPITSYDASTDNGVTWAAITTAGTGPYTATLSPLVNGTTYQVQVRAVTAAGPGAASNTMAVTPATVPGAPTLNSATAGNGQVVLAFSAPASDGGSAITAYTISDGVTTMSATSSPATFTGLTNGTQYTFSVTATNSVGTGAVSNTLTAAPAAPLPPDAPVITSASAYYVYANGYCNWCWPPQYYFYINASWTTPAANGSALTGYEYSIDSGAWTNTGNGTATSMSQFIGVCAYGSHTVAIRAISAAGASVSSAQATVNFTYYCYP